MADDAHPRVSIVVPTYNAAVWLDETLQSIAGQTLALDDVEVIVVDDASRDDSPNIARSFLAERPIAGRVVVHEKNAGVSATRNEGWQTARGTWIQFLDADDLLAPEKLELQMGCAEQLPDDVAVVYSSFQHVALNDGQWAPSGPVLEPDVDGETVERILQDMDFGYVGPTLIRREAVRSVGGFDERISLGEDIDLMLRLAMHAGRFRKAASDKPTFFYRETPQSLWREALAKPEATRNLVAIFRRAEEHLRARSADGHLSAAASDGLARRYSRWIELMLERDPEAFNETVAWIRGLGLTCPPGTGLGTRMATQLVGYGNALRLRLLYRRLRTGGKRQF
jgi:glycosyltransferase involved in cell wall biosynthesis